MNYCVDCDHYSEDDMVCRRPTGGVSLVTGRPVRIYEWAATERTGGFFSSRCGYAGAFYTPKARQSPPPLPPKRR